MIWSLRKYLFLIVLMAPAVSFCFSSGPSIKSEGRPGAFLENAASARSIGMGSAFTAVANDADATYWNAAGLSKVSRKDIVSLYSVMAQDTGSGFFSYAQPTSRLGTFGFSFVTVQSKNFEKHETDSATPTGTYETSQTAFLISNGFNLNNRWSLGATAKMVREQIDSYSGTGVGLDLGSMVKLSPRFGLGVSMSNLVAPSVKLKTEENRYPHKLTAGAQFLVLKNVLLAADFVSGEDLTRVNVGTEWSLNNLLSLRAGVNGNGITAGMGFQLGDWALDYAMIHYQAPASNIGLEASHRFGLHVSFGGAQNIRPPMPAALAAKPVVVEKTSEPSEPSKPPTRRAVIFKTKEDQVGPKYGSWKIDGKVCLRQLSALMDRKSVSLDEGTARLVVHTQLVIKNHGYKKERDLFRVKGYIQYLFRDYSKSVLYLGKALKMNSSDLILKKHLKKAIRKRGLEKK